MKTIRELWGYVTGRTPEPVPATDVIVHDPAAQKPRDLDDPFSDPEVQSRIASVIAESAEKSSKH